MCGRFQKSSPIEKIRSEFRIRKAFADGAPNYNIAPAEEILIITHEGEKQLVYSGISSA